MVKSKIEDSISRILMLGTPFISVFLVIGSVTDPVNVTKMFALSATAIALFALVVTRDTKYLWLNYRVQFLVIALFVLFSISSTFNSSSPFSQNFYGLYGRNTGLLTYVSLAFVLLAALFVCSRSNFRKILFGFFVAGGINLVYCAWVLAFGDFVGWYNPYGNILGLLGNPDFIAAFLGMFITAVIGYALDSENSIRIRFLKFGTLAASISTFGFFTVGLIAVMGTLQKGPFDFLYKKSVSLRGTYWKSGLEMGQSHPLTGVGMDSYGDWYRRSRPANALVDMPGVNTTSNVAHNVVVDLFASGGYPLLISYIATLTLGFFAIIQLIRAKKKYDGISVALTSTWLCYQIQSLISINQIGLAVWGWLFTGLLISYSRWCSSAEALENQPKESRVVRKRAVKQNSVISNGLISGIGLLIGAFIAFPPLSADAKWFSATSSKNLQKVESALTSNFFNPLTSFRYAEGVNLLDSSSLPDYAYRYAKAAVEFNPEYFDAWRQLYFLSPSDKEKQRAIANMKRLDPKNPDVTAP